MKNEIGCDLKKGCGFYCAFLRGDSPAWAAMVGKYCNGTEYPLCARRIYFLQTGFCAPLEVTPVGTLPKEILAEFGRKE